MSNWHERHISPRAASALLMTLRLILNTIWAIRSTFTMDIYPTPNVRAVLFPSYVNSYVRPLSESFLRMV
ncbi:hypothetical protein MUP79_07385 [Candidatus Bathyarchaeota archaeon]|nr:hypothetical protein [Candidatus Bathyarchaeota archaeon]